MKNLISQAVKFLGFSGVGWILDFFTYSLLEIFSGNLALNNIVSSWVGVTFVFMFATKKIFRNNNHIPLKLKYFIYLFYQVILIFLISKLLVEVDNFILEKINLEFIFKFSATISKIFVTPITMIINFIVMKIIVEKI